MSDMDINEVLRRLPQRYPFILVDRILSYEIDKSVVALKNVSMNEPYFLGHFPGRPVMPGVLILEALAQTCVLLNSMSKGETSNDGVIHFFAGIDNARFKNIVIPGDQLILTVEMIKQKAALTKCHGEATVNNKLVCSADLLSMTKDVTK